MAMNGMSNYSRRQIMDIGNRGRDFARGKTSFPKLVERMNIGDKVRKYVAGVRDEAAMEIQDLYDMESV